MMKNCSVKMQMIQCGNRVFKCELASEVININNRGKKIKVSGRCKTEYP